MRPETDLSHDLIAPLGPGGAEDASRFGRKAVTLSRLVSMGVPVKPGFAVSAEAVTRLAENGGLLRTDGSGQRRTPGGVFLWLVKQQATPEQRARVWPKASEETPATAK